MGTEKKVKPKKIYHAADKIYFTCQHPGCEEIVYKPMAAVAHTQKKHGLQLNFATIGDHFLELKDPPAAVVKEIRAKQEFREKYRAKKSKESTNFKCNECGQVFGAKGSLYGHCTDKHGESLKKIGYTETSEPTTNPKYLHKKNKGKRKKDLPLGPPLPLPGIISYEDAEVTDDGIVVTAKIKLPKEFLTNLIMPMFNA
jgi:hypothetical protein